MQLIDEKLFSALQDNEFGSIRFHFSGIILVVMNVKNLSLHLTHDVIYRRRIKRGLYVRKKK
jgi:hypothetical protein